ncbi:PREDICTED: vitamin K-dependent protein C-like [Priapulus caudatus]|uniref:Vitamin K-dependent protein C-like n=1 Tax=Priapulus caudatus TaxID=37621 RepID=A0ABM1E759_PRICU|nr:PREDICTED: vitamin K-dependent protein C-like [Priapulus caudatus]
MFILTAAHCVQGFEDVPDFFTVRLGSSAYETSTVSLVERIIVHPRYSSATFQNDVALLQLMAPVTYTDSIKPAVLAPITINTGKRAEAAEYAGMEATVSGWGRTDVKATADVLQKIDLTMLSNDDCRDYYSRNSIKSSMLCAGRLTDDVYSGPCYGDSGGPMVTSLSGLPVQVGIVSWGEGCLRPYPSVFTRVSSFREWISAAIVDALVAG